MLDEAPLIHVTAKALWRQRVGRGLLLMAALGCAGAMAETAHIPGDHDKYPQGVVAVPAVLSQCFACHGPGGQSAYEDWPSLAGQKQDYLLQQLRDFKSGARKHPMMQPIVANLSEADIKTAAAYFSAQAPAQPRNVTGKAAAAPAAGAACLACHDNAAVPDAPFLHGQKVGYLEAQLHAFKAGTRRNPVMEGMVKNLSDKDISDLAAYFSSQAPVSSTKK